MKIKWKLWEKKKDDAKKTASPGKMPDPLKDKIKALEESKKPATEGYVLKQNNALIEAIIDSRKLPELESLRLLKMLKDSIEEYKKSVNEESDEFQKKTVEQMRNLTKCFEDDLEQNKASQAKVVESASAEIRAKIDELSNARNELKESLDNKTKELSDLIDKKFLELTEQINSRLDSKLEEMERRMQAMEKSQQQQSATNENRMNEHSIRMESMRSKLYDSMEILVKYMKEDTKRTQAIPNINQIHRVLRVCEEILDAKFGIPCKESESYLFGGEDEIESLKAKLESKLKEKAASH